MFCEIITPDKKLFSGEIDLIQVPGSKGSFEILRKHAPIISTLDEGSIKIIDQNKKQLFIPIQSGVLECIDDEIIVLVEPLKENEPDL